MIDWQPMSSAPEDGTPVLLWLPGLNTADVGFVRHFEAGGMDCQEWVDQWNNDPYMDDKGNFFEPTAWAEVEPPEQENQDDLPTAADVRGIMSVSEQEKSNEY